MFDSKIIADEPGAQCVGDGEGQRHRGLAFFNRKRLTPGLPHYGAGDDRLMQAVERSYLWELRQSIARQALGAPQEAEEFVAWFEALKDTGPGQNHALFPFLAHKASLAQMRWFLEQEVAGEAGFEDLLAMTQVKMPTQAKLEMARNYWDELGRGEEKGMHGPMLELLAAHFGLKPEIETTVAEALALANTMTGLAFNRDYAFHSVGALGVIELTAPGRAAYVLEGLNRLGVPRKRSHYFALHAVLDVKHSQAWNREVLLPLVREDASRARAIAEGALMRLHCGARCFERYQVELNSGERRSSPAGEMRSQAG